MCSPFFHVNADCSWNCCLAPPALHVNDDAAEGRAPPRGYRPRTRDPQSQKHYANMQNSPQCFVGTTTELLLLFPNFQATKGIELPIDRPSFPQRAKTAGTLRVVLPILLAAALVLLVVAALFDWRARRRGEFHRTTGDYWRAVTEARRDERYAHAARYFARFLPKRPS